MNATLQQRIGWGLSGFVILFLGFDGVIKLVPIQAAVDSFAQLDYPLSAARLIGVIELVCVVLYAIPRTAVLGAVLLTGLFGGAIATHVRAGSPLLSHTFFSLYLSVFVWGGLWLRDERVRGLLRAGNGRVLR